MYSLDEYSEGFGYRPGASETTAGRWNRLMFHPKKMNQITLLETCNADKFFCHVKIEKNEIKKRPRLSKATAI